MAAAARVTCAGCRHLIKSSMSFGGCVIGCEETGHIVPHSADYKNGDAIFWRVPIECPLGNDDVVKSADRRRPERDWVKLRIADIREVAV